MASTSSIDMSFNKHVKEIPISRNSQPHITYIDKENCKNFICVQHPIISDNENRLLKCLGGKRGVEEALSGAPLSLKFRPDDMYSKAVVADTNEEVKIVLRVTARIPTSEPTSPTTSSNQPENTSTTYKYEFLGLTNKNYSFNRMADFQYLPLASTLPVETKDSPCKNIYEDIIPDKLPELEYLSQKESMVEFFPPPHFIKLPVLKEKLCYNRYEYYEHVLPEYAERLKKEALGEECNENDNMIRRTRPTRKLLSRRINFKAKNVITPVDPLPGALSVCKAKDIDKHLEIVKRLFEERPLWTKFAVAHKTSLGNLHLKVLLPCIAYYCTNGPWRAMWCRFGYNPTEDPNAYLYQSLDLRVSTDKLKFIIQPRRSFHVSSKKPSTKQSQAERLDESYYILKPGLIPPARQIFYQFCDIKIQEIESMLDGLQKNAKNLKYNAKTGWLPVGFQSSCREIATNLLNNIDPPTQVEQGASPKSGETLGIEELKINEQADVLVIDESNSSDAEGKINSDESSSEEEDYVSKKILQEIHESTGIDKDLLGELF